MLASVLFLFLSSMTRFLCSVVVSVSCFISSKTKQNTEWRGYGFVDEYIYVGGNALKFFNAIPSIDTYKFTP